MEAAIAPRTISFWMFGTAFVRCVTWGVSCIADQFFFPWINVWIDVTNLEASAMLQQMIGRREGSVRISGKASAETSSSTRKRRNDGCQRADIRARIFCLSGQHIGSREREKEKEIKRDRRKVSDREPDDEGEEGEDDESTFRQMVLRKQNAESLNNPEATHKSEKIQELHQVRDGTMGALIA